MGDPVKNLINCAGVKQLSSALREVDSSFNAAAFISLACQGLGSLELKERACQVRRALEVCLPPNFAEAASTIEALTDWLDVQGHRLDTWIFFPLNDWVGLAGRENPARALALLRRLTVCFSAEFGIRPLLVRDLAGTLHILEGWLEDSRPEVRRLISEGTRPRLPWGMQLRALRDDPEPMIPLLERLRDDPFESVRRSVANHLNDIGKDHPERLMALAWDWSAGAPIERKRLIRHACRSLLKQGDASAMRLHGYVPAALKEVRLWLQSRVVNEGGELHFRLDLTSASAKAQNLRLDYAIHFKKANGSLRPKVFCWKQARIGPRQKLEFARKISFRPVTTRKLYAGAHRIDIRVNGLPLAEADFELRLS